MAVYTDIRESDLASFLAGYDIGRLVRYSGIQEGVENSNFLIETDINRYILTIYEKRVDPADLPFFLGLMDHLAARGVRCPVPVHGRGGDALSQIAGKPAALVSFLPGQSAAAVTPARCHALGAALAALHLAAEGFAIQRPNALSVAGWRKLATATEARADELGAGLSGEVRAAFAALVMAWPGDLPHGVIHADLFADNVFFTGDEVSGIIDFYFACVDITAYDLAVCLNAWSFDGAGVFDVGRAHALFAGYRAVRPLSPAEIAAMPVLARGAALRFLLTRLYDWLNQVPGALVQPKDPIEYLAKLRFHATVTEPAAYGID